MKEEILKILNESPKSVDATFIMNKINESYTPEELKNLFDVLYQMEKEGLIVRNKSNEFMPFERSNFIKGKIDVTRSGNAFLIFGDDNDLFIHKKEIDKFYIMDGDEVICEVVKKGKGKEEGQIIRVLQRAVTRKTGEIYFENGEPKLKVRGNDKLTLTLRPTDLYLVDGSIVKLKYVKNISDNNIEVEVEEILTHKNAPEKDAIVILSEFNRTIKFSDEALAEAASMPKVVINEEIINRRDLRNEEIYTIDGSDTKDMDDAVGLIKLKNGNYRLTVSISDLSHYVKMGSKLMDEAIQRGNSDYLAGIVNPQFPPELSIGICSLNPSTDRLTKTVIVEITPDGKIANYEIVKSVIHSREKMAYEEVNKLFAGNPSEKYLPYKESLENMLELSKILDDVKKKRGSIEFESSEVKLIFNDNKECIDIKKREEGLAENLIENFMILANVIVGHELSELNSPMIYRVHKSPAPELIKKAVKKISILGHSLPGKINYNDVTPVEIQNLLEHLKESPDYIVTNKIILRSMDKAIYYPENLGHFALAYKKDYTHFTSPIRRVCDLLVHYFLDEVVFGSGLTENFKKHWENALPYICEHISETERTSEEAERESNNLEMAKYMLNRIGQEYEGIVCEARPKGFFVSTENLINGFIKLETLKDFYKYKEELMGYVNAKGRVAIRIGDRVVVKCIGANVDERQIDFALVRKV